MKPPRKIPRPGTPDTDQTVRPNRAEDGTPPRYNLPDIDISGPPIDLPGRRRPEGGSDNTPREPQIAVVDISTPGPLTLSPAVATSDITFLPSALIPKLPAPGDDGLRYGQLRSKYAEIENEGVTLVRLRDDGEYQASSASELTPTGPLLERIAGTAYWRRKNTDNPDRPAGPPPDEQPGPSTRSRPRPAEGGGNIIEANPMLAELIARPIAPLDLSVGLLQNWGKTTQPQSVESLEINGLHYRIVPEGRPEDYGVAFVEHPRFTPSSFEKFEQMLQEDPSLQPRWAIRRHDQWEALERPFPFDNTLTGYVAGTFRDFSDATLNSVARTLFNRANHSEVINGEGLLVVKQTLRNWADPLGPPSPRRELSDPLLMLPILNRSTRSNRDMVVLPESTGALQRVDFAPDRFPREWHRFTAQPDNYNLKEFMASVLARNGYDVFPVTRGHEEPTLVFTRSSHDSVFFLKLGNVTGDAIRYSERPGNELSNPQLATRIGELARAKLLTAFNQDKVVWLAGGIQTTPSGGQSVFIIREG
ncbi:hypothetical protein ACW9HW_23155 [Pseudomonas sp. SDO5532_S415]|uniref:hypothetical protein n=1 Tax=Pseudomonas sp. Irchel 3A7 TaxID=2008913 RepID=UPI00114075FA|nr:hypothetical protein [Pseudomonas sp. Irchel 3A7]